MTQLGNTPLHWSAIYNSIDSMLILLDADADVTNLNNEKESVLHLAVVQDRVDFMRKILSTKHDINLVIPGPMRKENWLYYHILLIRTVYAGCKNHIQVNGILSKQKY